MKVNKFIVFVFTALLSLSISKTSFCQSVPLKITDTGFIFVTVSINDSITADFLLDTGGGMNVLSNKVYQKIKPTAKFHSFETGFRHDGERIDGELFEIPSISIDSYKLTDVLTGMYAPLDQYGIDGIISLKFFENKPFTIDFKNKILTIETKKSLKKIIGNSTMIPILLDVYADYAIDMYIPVILNGTLTLNAEFDTGSGYNTLIIRPEYMSKLGLDVSNTKKQDYTTPITQTKLNDYVTSLNSVQINGLTSTEMKNKNVTFREKMIHPALIGSEMFKDKAITIDIQNKKMYVR